MSKVSIDDRNGKIIIVNKISYPETINERVYSAIVAETINGLLPLTILKKKKVIKLECVVQGLIPLNQYFDGIINKKQFLNLVHKLIVLVKDCERNLLNVSNLEFQSNMIFVDVRNKNISCIYWPVVNGNRNNLIVPFFKKLPDELYFNTREDNMYLEKYRAFFSGKELFSIRSFERMITKLMEADSVERGILVRLKTNEKFLITDNVFRVGTDSKQCDLIIPNNPYVSRKHADILLKGTKYYIVDHNSTNYTFVEGRIIPSEKEVELQFGMKIKLADESFVFERLN